MSDNYKNPNYRERNLAGRAVRVFTEPRVPMNVHPEVRERLRKLLLKNPEMRGVGYSEFLDRACERAEEEIVNLRREAKADEAHAAAVRTATHE